MSDNKKQPSKSNTAKSSTPTAPQKVENENFAFGTMNYVFLAIGILLLGIGYILLAGGGSDDPNVFNEAMFNSRRLVVAPIIIVAGLVVEICAIMFRPKNNNSEE